MKSFIRFINRRLILTVIYHLSKIGSGNTFNRVILCYHGIGKDGNNYTVSLENFEKQMITISKYADFVDLTTILKPSKKQIRPMVSVTFDDGYEDFLMVVPILKKLGIKATLFALSNPEFADRKELDHAGKLLTDQQLRKLYTAGVAIGCHSKTHADFYTLQSEMRKVEIIDAKRTMEKKLQFPIRYFAYPKGRITAKNAQLVKSAGFRAAFTTFHDHALSSQDAFSIPRVVIDSTYSTAEFPAVIAPSTFAVQKLQRIISNNRIFVKLKILVSSSKSQEKKRMKSLSQRKTTVSVGTSIYNEEENILNFLKHVQAQVGSNIIVKEIIIINDGSTDKTSEIIRNFPDKRIKCIDYKERQGKSSRLNELFKLFNGDALVVLDGDGYPASTNTFSRLIAHMQSSDDVGLVAGEMDPVLPETLLEEAVVSYYRAHYKATRLIDYSTSAYGCHGLLAYRKSFAKSLTIPSDCIVDDAYSYFSCLAEGFTYAFARDAKVRYRCPQSRTDYLSQSLRYYAGGEQLFRYFSRGDIIRGYSLPRNVLFATLLLQLQQNTVGYLYLKLMHAYVLYKTRVKNLDISSQWLIIKSSKML